MPPSLASRLLFHAQPGHQPPALLATPNVAPELTPELYDFIALALRAYVSPWWAKLTRYDKDLLPQISAVLTHVIRALDERVRAQDLPALVFQDVPAILTQHYRDYRNAAAKTATAYASGGAASLPTLFAQLQPHMAVSPEGVVNREYYRQIVDHILRATLPPEDYDPEPERIIIREVVVKILLDDIMPRIVQPWFIHKSILDLIGDPVEPFPSASAVSAPFISIFCPPFSAEHAFSFHNLIIIVLSALQSFSGMCLALIHGYKQAISTIKLVQQSPPPSPKPTFIVASATTVSAAAAIYSAPDVPSHNRLPSSSKAVRATASLVSEPSTTSSASSTPGTSTYSTPTATLPAFLGPSNPKYTLAPSQSHQLQSPPPAYAHAPLLLLAELISASERFAATTALTTTHMLCAALTPFLDKLLPHMLHQFLSPAFILNTVRLSKRTLFPNGYPGPQPPDPTPEEQAELRARLVAWRGKGGLALLTPILLGPDPSATLGAALDPLSDAQCNLRLAVFLLDRVLVGLFPELIGVA
ncbi:PXA domain-containing protein [Pholiota molesta]|nr:PXA domain-containing protein [Pholiota molesta]